MAALLTIYNSHELFYIAFQLVSLVGHEDAVQSCVFDLSGDFLVSGGSDLSVRIWS